MQVHLGSIQSAWPGARAVLYTHHHMLEVEEALLLIAARCEQGDGPEVCVCCYHSIHNTSFVLLLSMQSAAT